MFRGDIVKYLSGFIHDLIPLSSSVKAPVIMVPRHRYYTHSEFTEQAILKYLRKIFGLARRRHEKKDLGISQPESRTWSYGRAETQRLV